MSARYFLTPAARRDLIEIDAYIRRESHLASAKVLGSLRKAMRQLAQWPGIGHLRADLADEPLRFRAVGSYLIVYRAEVRPIQIVRILHGARDVEAVLAES